MVLTKKNDMPVTWDPYLTLAAPTNNLDVVLSVPDMDEDVEDTQPLVLTCIRKKHP